MLRRARLCLEMAPLIHYDNIIIGGGTAGCLIANRLASANDGQRKVLLLEAGQPGRNNPLVNIPAGYLGCIGNPSVDWMYQTEPEPRLNNRSLLYPRGKVLGGCSSINAMIYMRGQKADYDKWAEVLDDPEWTWDKCLPYFMRHEKHWFENADAKLSDAEKEEFRKYHSTQGEFPVERAKLRWDFLDAFIESAEACGIPKSNDFNRGENVGVGYFDINQSNGRRCSTETAFLLPAAKKHSNLHVITGCTALKLVFGKTGHRCCGITYFDRDSGLHKVVSLMARGEVVCCAGAINTPKLLMLSGIGPEEHLAQVGVRVRIDNPEIGRNLQDHLQVRTMFKLSNARTMNTMTQSLSGKVKIGMQYLLGRTGPLTMAPSQLCCFAKSTPQEERTNVEFHVQPLTLDAFGEPLHPFDAFTVSVCNLQPTSTGRVELSSPNPVDPPRIICNYLDTERDRKVAADSIRLARKIVAQDPMKQFTPEEFAPGIDVESDEELIAAAGKLGTTIFHPTCTTRMARRDDPIGGVVDSRLMLRGTDNVRIADAGVMPCITSGNTNAPVLMIAERCAEWMTQDEGWEPKQWPPQTDYDHCCAALDSSSRETELI